MAINIAGAESFSLPEYLILFSKVTKDPADEEKLLEAFKAFDTAGIGVISANDLRSVMLNLGEG